MSGVMEHNGYHCPDAQKLQELKDCANRMRVTSIECTNAAKSGHPTSSTSAAEIVSCLFFDAMKYDPRNPRDPSSDRFILSKGHASPILYAAWKEAGFLTKEQVMTLRKIDSDIEGHPTPRLEFVDVATGSLGQGLSCGAGMAYTGKYFDKASYRVYVLIGDGESAEGSVWEAAAFASYYKLDNLVAIFDVNRLGQSQPTMLKHEIDTYAKRLEAFGWHVLPVDGHDIVALCKAFHEASTVQGKPVALIAKTLKGKGIPGVEDLEGWHGKALGAGHVEVIEKGISNKGKIQITPPAPVKDAPKLTYELGNIKLSEPPNYKPGDKVATRLAYGTGLAKLGAACDRVIALDGDTKNSTFADKFMKQCPDRFIECFIAEQNLLGVAIGCGTRGRTIPFCSTFAAFYSRAFDQLRMGAVSQTNITCCGSHVGVSIGEDGPSQMGLEDIALFRALFGSTVFYPSDAVSTERAVELSANTKGICFIRTSRPNADILYKNDEVFEIGKAKVVRQSATDKVVVIGASVTLTEALKAADKLKGDVGICVIDPFTIKPIDKETILKEALRCGGKIITVEDHYPAGGIGEAVSAAFSDDTRIMVRSLAVRELPRSGPPNDLLEMFGISARHIVDAVKQWVK